MHRKSKQRKGKERKDRYRQLFERSLVVKSVLASQNPWHVCVGVSAVTLSRDGGELEEHYLILAMVNALQVDFFDPASRLAFKGCWLPWKWNMHFKRVFINASILFSKICIRLYLLHTGQTFLLWISIMARSHFISIHLFIFTINNICSTTNHFLCITWHVWSVPTRPANHSRLEYMFPWEGR